MQGGQVVRDVSGKEIAIYNSPSLQQWNIWGLDNVGKINADTTKNYYLKDHLGSTRCIINSTNTVVSAQDYDCWGYLLENRTYQPENTKYKFTGKERDNELENNYDYFGARYYDSRIANWTSIDPLFEKHIQCTPYNYVLRNPIFFMDPDGMQLKFSNNEEQRNQQVNDLKNLLPPEVNQYVSTTQGADGSYILDAQLLENASEVSRGNSSPSELGKLMSIANSNTETELNYYNNSMGIISANITGKSGIETATLSKNLVGLTIVSGNVDNTQIPKNYSTSGHNEVYILSTQSGIERAKTVAHELFGHVYNYLNKSEWGHSKPKNPVFESHISDIEAKAAKNYHINVQ